MSATCNYCNQEMKENVSCTVDVYSDFPDGIARKRFLVDIEGLMCDDCNAPDGGLHHPGCDVERCPGCGGQAISCECTREEDEDDW